MTDKREKEIKKVIQTIFSDEGIGILLLLSMFMINSFKVIGISLYVFMLFLIAIGFLGRKIWQERDSRKNSLPIHTQMDIAAGIFLLYGFLKIIGKMFQNPDKGAIDFSSYAMIISYAALYFLIVSGGFFRKSYLDMILYSGLLIMGGMLYIYFAKVPQNTFFTSFMENAGTRTSYLLLVSMAGIYAYCICRDRLRSWFYLLVVLISYFLLFLNENRISFWLLTIYFLAIPVVFRPTAALIKRDMQLFFLFGFLLSNMSLLSQYADFLPSKLSYSLEHSVYLELLLALGGIFFFQCWEKIPEGIDLERLVMRKIRKGCLFLLRIVVFLFMGIVLNGNRWENLADNGMEKVVKDFALPLATQAAGQDSGFYFMFHEMEMIVVIFVLYFFAIIIGRFKKNWQMDKPDTSMCILISSMFIIQLLFWKVTENVLTVYFVFLLLGAFAKEDKHRVTSIKIKDAEEIRNYKY